MSKIGKAHFGTPETSTARNIDDILNETMTPASRARAKKRADRILERMRLDELRKDRKMSQRALASALGTDQGEISRIEKRSNVQLSTLRSIVGAMGGHIEVRAVFPDKNVELAFAAD